jgi:nucleoside-diphosphate-sugar epimerase
VSFIQLEWRYYLGQKFLLIGAMGQLSLTLAEQLQNLDCDVTGIVQGGRSIQKLEPFGLFKSVESNDLTNPRECWNLLDRINPHSIFHFAGVHGGRNSMINSIRERGSDMLRTHVTITKNILEWQRFNNFTSSHFALSSQMYSVGLDGDKLIDEKSKETPINFYGETKLLARRLIQRYRRKYDVSANGYILFNNASTYTKPGFLISDLATKISFLIKNPTSAKSVYVENSRIDISVAKDFCDAILICERSKIIGDFVLGSNRWIHVNEIINSVFLNLRLSDKIRPQLIDVKENLLISNTSKIRDLTGWRPHGMIHNIICDIIKREG